MLKDLEKAKEISQDDLKSARQRFQNLTDDHISRSSPVGGKRKEIMGV